MSNELFEEIVTKAKDEVEHLEMCTVSGYGEPTTDPSWRVKLVLASEHFKRIHVVTNLSLLTQDGDLEALAKYATEVRVSLNAAGDESYRKIHRSPSRVTHRKVERAIDRLCSLREDDFSIRLSFVQVVENEDQVRAWIKKWQGKVDGLDVWRPHNWVNGKKYRKSPLKKLASCGRPASGPIQVQVDGTVNICCFDYNGKIVVGDLKTQSFKEIFDGEEMKQIRKLHESGRADELDLCAVCDQREPSELRKKHLVYCSWASPDFRVTQTSSGKEKIR